MNKLITASRNRILLATYIDFVLFSALLTLVLYVATGRTELATWQELIAFSLVEMALHLSCGSPGFYSLGITKAKATTQNAEGQPISQGTLLVDPLLYEHENWLTMLLGTLFIVEGGKELTRWMLGMPTLPVFGIATDITSFAIFSLVLGGMEIYIGYNFLQLKLVGLWFGLTGAVSIIVSVVLSWGQWDELAREMVIRRRSFQGLQVREGEVAFMQTILPEAVIILTLLIIIAMSFSRKRLRY